MALSRPFAYNPGSLIPGTEQLGSLSIGYPTSGFTNNPQYWNGPDEELGYVIAQSVSGNTQPTEIPGVFASVGFFRSTDLTEGSFITLSETIAGQSFANGEDAKTWLNNNGYWTSYETVPNPTPTPTVTSTPTSSVTPEPTSTTTPTPTPTDTSSLITYTISGCSSLEVLVVDLQSTGFVPGDVLNLQFTGDTPTGCYTIINKINSVPSDGIFTSQFFFSCSECLNQTIETYTISGCTNSEVLVVDLESPNFAPGDVLNLQFTGVTPTGCYTVIEKVFDTPSEDTILTSSFFLSCALCEASLITPTPTNTSTPTSTPTPSVTATLTPTPTPTSTPGGDWGFYLANGGTITRAPNFNGDALFSYSGSSNAVYNPNYTGGTFNIYFNNTNKAGTSYLSQFTTLKNSGGTITINQGSSTAIYSGTSSNYSGSTGTFLRLIVNRSAQMIQSASTSFVSGTTINVVVS